jgi:hypothetical protein
MASKMLIFDVYLRKFSRGQAPGPPAVNLHHNHIIVHTFISISFCSNMSIQICLDYYCLFRCHSSDQSPSVSVCSPLASRLWDLGCDSIHLLSISDSFL